VKNNIHERNSTRLVASTAISGIGTWSYNVGIAVYAFNETHSSTWVALATVGRYMPALFLTQVFVRYADRLPRKLVSVQGDVICAVLMLVLTVIAAFHLSIILAIAIAALSSSVSRVQSGATQALAGDVIPERSLARTATAMSSAESVATALGPAIASIVIALSGPIAVFALNGLSFTLSAVLISGLVGESGSQIGPSSTKVRAAANDNATREVYRTVRPLLVIRGVCAFLYGCDVVVLAVVATEKLSQGTTAYGWLLASAGVGGLAVAWLINKRSEPARSGSIPFGVALYAGPLLLFIFASNLVAAIPIQVVRGMGCVLASGVVISVLQRSVPSALAGKVLTNGHSIAMIGTSLGAIAAPILLGLFGLPTTLTVVTIAALAATAVVTPKLMVADRAAAQLIESVDPRVSLLRSLDLFESASRSTLHQLAENLVESQVATGVDIIVEGDRADALHIIVDGSVDISHGQHPNRIHVRDLSAPVYVGEIGLLHSVPRTATVTTATACTIWTIPAAVFLEGIMNAGVSNALSDGISLRMKSSQFVGN